MTQLLTNLFEESRGEVASLYCHIPQHSLLISLLQDVLFHCAFTYEPVSKGYKIFIFSNHELKQNKHLIFSADQNHYTWQLQPRCFFSGTWRVGMH